MYTLKLSNEKTTFAKGVKAYQNLWGAKKDKVKYSDEARNARRRAAATVDGVESFYDFITVAYLAGWGEHFHFTPFAPDEPIKQGMAFFAHKLANTMGLKPGMKVLDVGCGVGGPAREIAKFIGCQIVGLNINQGHIDRAVDMTADAGLAHLVTFVRGDFMEMPFAAATFDAVYAIEATAHAPSLAQVYKNIHRVLKPGGTFFTSEWVLTSNFDALDEAHVQIRNHIERGNAVPSLPSVEHARDSLRSAGFEVTFEENYAHHWKNFLTYQDRDPGSQVNRPMSHSSSSPLPLTTRNTAKATEMATATPATISTTESVSASKTTEVRARSRTTDNKKKKRKFRKGEQSPEHGEKPNNTKGEQGTATGTGTGTSIRSKSSPSPTPTPTLKKAQRPSSHPSSQAREWYYPLQGKTALTANTTDWWLTWKMSGTARKTSYWTLRVLEKCGLYPRGVTDAMDIVREAVDGLAMGGELDIFSPCWWFLGRKAAELPNELR